MDTKYKNDNIIRGGDSNDQWTSLAKLNAAVYCPSARSHDQFTLLHRTVIPHGDHRNAPDRIIASGLSEFTGSARFNSSRHKGGLLTVGLDAYPLEEPYRISSGIASSTESVKEYGTKSTFPDATDILLERADTWRNTLSHSDPNNPLTRAPKAFQPKTWQSFKPEFTQPYRFTYFVDKQ